MRHASKYLAALVALALISAVANGADKSAATTKPALLHGHITKIDGKSITLTIGRGAKAHEITVVTDENTHFSIDHEPCNLEDLKEGELAAVTPMEGTAQHVDINTTHKDKKKPADSGTTAPPPPADKPADSK